MILSIKDTWHNSIMLSVVFNLLFCWVWLCWMSLCWMSLCWMSWRRWSFSNLNGTARFLNDHIIWKETLKRCRNFKLQFYNIKRDENLQLLFFSKTKWFFLFWYKSPQFPVPVFPFIKFESLFSALLICTPKLFLKLQFNLPLPFN